MHNQEVTNVMHDECRMNETHEQGDRTKYTKRGEGKQNAQTGKGEADEMNERGGNKLNAHRASYRSSRDPPVRLSIYLSVRNMFQSFKTSKHLCNIQPLHHCNFAPLQLCTFATFHLSNVATL